jgi:hypothetical protein
MCLGCSLGVPVCSGITGICDPNTARNVNTLLLATAPMAGTAGLWIKTKLKKKKRIKSPQ